jgi:hypothetical protein
VNPFPEEIYDGSTSALGVETWEDLNPDILPQDNPTHGGIRINNAFFAFPKGHAYIEYLLRHVASSYKPDEWAAIGPDLVTDAYKKQPDDVQNSIQLLFPIALYPLHWARAHALLNEDRTMVDKDWPPEVRNQTFGLHVYNSNSWRNEVNGVTMSFYRLEAPPEKALIKEIVDRVAIPACDALRIPAKEARERKVAREAAAAAAG